MAFGSCFEGHDWDGERTPGPLPGLARAGFCGKTSLYADPSCPMPSPMLLAMPSAAVVFASHGPLQVQ